MIEQDEELLLKDICARLPYGVKYRTIGSDFAFTLKWIDKLNRLDGDVRLENAKIFLRSLSSMTEEEIVEFNNISSTKNYTIIENDLPWDVAHYKQIDWLNAHHFDYRGLILKGLAIEVTENNNPYKEIEL